MNPREEAKRLFAGIGERERFTPTWKGPARGM